MTTHSDHSQGAGHDAHGASGAKDPVCGMTAACYARTHATFVMLTKIRILKRRLVNTCNSCDMFQTDLVAAQQEFGRRQYQPFRKRLNS